MCPWIRSLVTQKTGRGSIEPVFLYMTHHSSAPYLSRLTIDRAAIESASGDDQAVVGPLRIPQSKYQAGSSPAAAAPTAPFAPPMSITNFVKETS